MLIFNIFCFSVFSTCVFGSLLRLPINFEENQGSQEYYGNNVEIKEETSLIVQDWKQDVIYLIQPPRISTIPCYAYASLFLETFLRMNNKNVQVISNQFFLGSTFEGTVPFAQYNGYYISGTKTLTKKVKFGKEVEYNKEEIAIMKIIKKLHLLLLSDRITRNEKGKGGLDWMKEDKLIRRHLTANDPNIQIKFDTESGYEFTHRKEVWDDYFDSIEDKNKRKEFMKKNFKNKRDKNWDEFHSEMNEFISNNVEKNIKNFENKISAYLVKLNNDINITESDFKGQINEIVKYLEKKKYIEIENKSNEPKYILNNNPINPDEIDAALFAILVQFFETPLNKKFLRKFFGTNSLKNFFEKEDKNSGESQVNETLNNVKKFKDEKIEILYNFVEKIKKTVFGENEWNKVKTGPWMLNSVKDEIIAKENKYNGNYNIETDELNEFTYLLETDYLLTREEKELASTSFRCKPNVDKIQKKEEEELALNKIKIYNNLIQQIRENLIKYLKENWKNEENRKKYGHFVLKIAAAYLCNLGKGKAIDDGCKEKYLKEIKDYKKKEKCIFSCSDVTVMDQTGYKNTIGEHDLINKIKIICYNTIEEYYNNKIISERIRNAIFIANTNNYSLEAGSSKRAQVEEEIQYYAENFEF